MKVADIDPKVLKNLEKLHDKYAHTDQNMAAHLEGLYHANLPNYWKYLNLDTLLTLQNPVTSFPDEMIFVTFHQIAELKFKLIQWEIEQISEGDLSADRFLEKLKRICRYYELLINEFSIVHEGLDREQFRQFRMALIPGSGFQSAQYRQIEFKCTDAHNLLAVKYRLEMQQERDFEKLYNHLYWKVGMLENSDGETIVGLEQVEKKYKAGFLDLMASFSQKNVWQIYVRNYVNISVNTKLEEQMRRLDTLCNVNWPLVHYRTAIQHLVEKNQKIEATGGSNWTRYLPPRFQKVIFFPDLWSNQEKEEWGKTWVNEILAGAMAMSSLS